MKTESVLIRVHPWSKKLFMVVVGLVASVTLAFAADPLAETLQKGLFEEEANHNLDAAIKAYQSVIDQSQEQRRVAATALFRLGECYRKLNKTNDAAGYYERLLRDFSDQATLANLSRQNLSVLGVAKTERQSGATDAATSGEAEVLQRIQAMIKSSPDLINARGRNGATPLHDAADAGQLTVARFLLANRADINGRDDLDATPLHYAAWSGHQAMCELLLTSGADVNARGTHFKHNVIQSGTALHLAIRNGYQAVTETLLRNKADPNAPDSMRQTPLHIAVIRGQVGLAEMLLKNGADINAANKIQNLPIHEAATKGALDMAKLLVAHKTKLDVRNQDGYLPLHLAVNNRAAEVVRFLLQSGSDINALARNGRAAVHLAAMLNSEDVLKALLDFKPNLEVETDGGLTPLFMAVMQKAPRAAELLLEAGANPNPSVGTFKTPLIQALSLRQREIALTLLDHKADPNLAAADGTTPLRLLRDVRSNPGSEEARFAAEMEPLLIERGADPNIYRRKTISLTRQGQPSPYNFFEIDHAGHNQHTLFELVAFLYQGRNQQGFYSIRYPFPDLKRLTVERLVDNAKGTNRITVDLEKRLGTCEDFPLEWGDVVVIPEKDHKLNESWFNLGKEVHDQLEQCTERAVVIRVKGQDLRVKLRPDFKLGSQQPAYGSLPITTMNGVTVLHWFSLQYVVRSSGALRASSDLTRVKLSRAESDGQKRRILMFNLDHRYEDIWLQDGDVIEVPDKDS